MVISCSAAPLASVEARYHGHNLAHGMLPLPLDPAPSPLLHSLTPPVLPYPPTLPIVLLLPLLLSSCLPLTPLAPPSPFRLSSPSFQTASSPAALPFSPITPHPPVAFTLESRSCCSYCSFSSPSKSLLALLLQLLFPLPLPHVLPQQLLVAFLLLAFFSLQLHIRSVRVFSISNSQVPVHSLTGVPYRLMTTSKNIDSSIWAIPSISRLKMHIYL